MILIIFLLISILFSSNDVCRGSAFEDSTTTESREKNNNSNNSNTIRSPSEFHTVLPQQISATATVDLEPRDTTHSLPAIVPATLTLGPPVTTTTSRNDLTTTTANVQPTPTPHSHSITSSTPRTSTITDQSASSSGIITATTPPTTTTPHATNTSTTTSTTTSEPCVKDCLNGGVLFEFPFCRCDCSAAPTYTGERCEVPLQPCLWQSCAECSLVVDGQQCPLCPIESPVRCPDGHCYSEHTRCSASLCTAAQSEAFVCVAGKERAPECTTSPLACLRRAEAYEQCGEHGCCWDGTLRHAASTNGTHTCAPVPACGPLRVRCADGRCRDALAEQPCADDDGRDAPLLAGPACAAGLTRCADGRCYSASAPERRDACDAVPHEACAVGEVLCWSGRCVTQWEECADSCPFPFWRCDDGSCAETCLPPRRMLRPTPFEVVIHGDQATSVRVLSDGHTAPVQELFTMTVPRGALVAASTPEEPSVEQAAAAAAGDESSGTLPAAGIEATPGDSASSASLGDKTRHVVYVSSMPHSAVRRFAGADRLLAAAIDLRVSPPLLRALSPEQPLLLQWPNEAIAIPANGDSGLTPQPTATPQQRKLCVAAVSPTNQTDSWDCVARLVSVQTSNVTFAWQASVYSFGAFSLRYEPAPPLPTADFKTQTPSSRSFVMSITDNNERTLASALVTAFIVAASVCVGGTLCIAACFLLVRQQRDRMRAQRDRQRQLDAAREADLMVGRAAIGMAPRTDNAAAERRRMLDAGVSPLLLACVDYLQSHVMGVTGLFGASTMQSVDVRRRAETWLERYDRAVQSDNVSHRSADAAATSNNDAFSTGGGGGGGSSGGGGGAKSSSSDTTTNTPSPPAVGVDRRATELTTLSLPPVDYQTFSGSDRSTGDVPDDHASVVLLQLANESEPHVVARIVALYFARLPADSPLLDAAFFERVNRIEGYRAGSFSPVLVSNVMREALDDDSSSLSTSTGAVSQQDDVVVGADLFMSDAQSTASSHDNPSDGSVGLVDDNNSHERQRHTSFSIDDDDDDDDDSDFSPRQRHGIARRARRSSSPRRAVKAARSRALHTRHQLGAGGGSGVTLSRVDELANAVHELDDWNYLTLLLVCRLFNQVHSNASINKMTAFDLQESLYASLLPPSKGDYKDIIGDLIAHFAYVFATDDTWDSVAIDIQTSPNNKNKGGKTKHNDDSTDKRNSNNDHNNQSVANNHHSNNNNSNNKNGASDKGKRANRHGSKRDSRNISSDDAFENDEFDDDEVDDVFSTNDAVPFGDMDADVDAGFGLTREQQRSAAEFGGGVFGSDDFGSERMEEGGFIDSFDYNYSISESN